MGWKARLLAVSAGLFFFGIGLWPAGLLCVVYLVAPARPKKERGDGRKPGKWLLLAAHFSGIALLILAGLALTAGGALSPLVFLSLGAAVLAGPYLRPLLPTDRVEPVEDSILLRSKYVPLAWHAVAEVKPGADPFPRAAASFEGRLAVFTETGRAYLLVECKALGRRDAELKLLHLLRSACPRKGAGAYLLPLDSDSASELFKLRLSRVPSTGGPLTDLASGGPGIAVLDCVRDTVRRAAAFVVEGGATSSRVPSGTSGLKSAPLTWEVLDSLGRRTSWPDPDGVSNLLDSFVATRGVPLGDRLKTLEGDGAGLKVESLAGERLRLSRAQLRAIVSVYP